MWHWLVSITNSICHPNNWTAKFQSWSPPKGRLPCKRSVRLAAWVRLCCCRHTAEILKLVHLLPVPRSSACASQSLPNHYCSEMIFHRAVKTLTSQSTTLFQLEERIKIFIFLKFSLKSKGKCVGVKIIFWICFFLLNLLNQKNIRARSLKPRSILHVLAYLF